LIICILFMEHNGTSYGIRKVILLFRNSGTIVNRETLCVNVQNHLLCVINIQKCRFLNVGILYGTTEYTRFLLCGKPRHLPPVTKNSSDLRDITGLQGLAVHYSVKFYFATTATFRIRNIFCVWHRLHNIIIPVIIIIIIL
jgi:hypothetical protein